MRISSATLLIILVCLIGGLATGSLIVSQYFVVQKSQAATEATRLSGRDLLQLKVMMSQWYVTIDLFFEDGDSYVARGILKQAKDIEKLWKDLSGTTNENIDKGALYIGSAATEIEKLAITGPAQKVNWNAGLELVDDNTLNFVELFESESNNNATQLLELADELEISQEQLKTYAWISMAIYLVLISLAWIWANRTIVRPIRNLEELTHTPAGSDPSTNKDRFAITNGPLEIKQLGLSLGNYVNDLAAKTETIEQQKLELEKRLEELERTRNQLIQAEKIASVGQLAAGVAHEINNPMAFITSNLSSLSNYIDDMAVCLNTQNNYLQKSAIGAVTNEETEEALSAWKTQDIEFVLEDCTDVLSDINDGTTRITRIVEGLSEFTDSSHETVEASLSTIVTTALESIPEHNALELKPSVVLSENSIATCAPERIEHAVRIIITNALEASTQSAEAIEITTGGDPTNAWIEVADTGVGIEQDNLNKIFDPFFTTKPVGGGIGLNLHFVQSIIDQHNGAINVESELGKGTKMRLTLSRQSEAAIPS